MARWANENAYDDLVRVNASRYSVPFHIVKAVIAAESAFNPDARRGEPASSTLGPTADFPQGGDESRGLMQLLVRTARALGFNGPKDDLFRPSVNIGLGTKLLQENYARSQDWPGAISAYNGGYRPHLAFGEPNTTGAPIRVCLWRRTDGSCGEWAVALAGQFGNQAYVDKVLNYANYFFAEEDDLPYTPPGLGPEPVPMPGPDVPIPGTGPSPLTVGVAITAVLAAIAAFFALR